MNIAFIIIVCLLPILLFLDWTKTFREKFPDTFGYILSLVGTFAGIVIGLYVTDIRDFRSKEQTTIKILETSKEELEWFIKRCEVMTTTLDTLPNRKRDKFLHLEIPPFFSETIRSQIIIEMVQPTTMEQFNIIKENLIFDSKMLRMDFKEMDKKKIKFDTEDYKRQLLFTIKIIEYEIKLLNGDIKKSVFESESKKRIKLLMEE